MDLDCLNKSGFACNELENIRDVTNHYLGNVQLSIDAVLILIFIKARSFRSEPDKITCQ